MIPKKMQLFLSQAPLLISASLHAQVDTQQPPTSNLDKFSEEGEKVEVKEWVAPARIKDRKGAYNGTGLAFHFGVTGGWMMNFPSEKHEEFEGEKAGYSVGFKGMASIFLERTLFHVSGGWQVFQLSGDMKNKIGPNGEVDQKSAEFRLGFGEFGGFFRMTPTWYIGPSARVYFGADGSFSPFKETESSTHVLGGLTLGYENPTKAGGLGVSLNYHTDVSIKERTVHHISLDFSFGFPIVKQDVIYQEKLVTKTKTKTKIKIETKLITQTVKEKGKNVVTDKVILDSEVINFKINSAQPSYSTQQFLNELGKFLAKNNDGWIGLMVEGHTDNTGKRDYNIALSKKRATQVAVTLLRAGVPRNKVRIKGHGPDHPIDTANTDIARARNRRVEFRFYGLKIQKEIKEKINELKARFHTPETCAGADCD